MIKPQYIVFGIVFLTSVSILILEYKSGVDVKDSYMPKLSHLYQVNGQLDKKDVAKLLDNILLIGQSIHNAEKHVRGMKTAHYLKLAKDQLRVALNVFGSNNTNITKPTEVKSKNICPEKYKGTKFGYPFYETGFVEENCTYSKPLSQLITILTFGSFNRIEKLLLSIKKTNADIKVIASIHTKDKKSIENKFKNKDVLIVSHEAPLTPGKVWNNLMRLVKTEYVFISRDATEIDEYSRFGRLIREIEIQNKSIASGSIRNITSHWRIGCYQRAFRNYSLVYYEGYDESVNECLICDHVDGPFVMKTEISKIHKFNEKILSEGVYEDFFIRVGTEKILNCPDVMFHVDQPEKSKDFKKWKVFANIVEAVRLRFIPGFEINFPCTSSTNCYKGGKYAIHPCCLQRLSNIIILGMEVCDKAHTICELDAGTLLSGTKMNSVSPWEVDGDIIFLRSNRSILQRTANKIKNGRFTISPAKDYLWFNVKDWFLEVWAQSRLMSERYIKSGRNQTKILLNGRWLGVGRNPALMVRNRYGVSCFQHSVHWRYQGFKSSWINYQTKSFPKCTLPGNHKCMDLFRTDGNLQFSDPIP